MKPALPLSLFAAFSLLALAGPASAHAHLQAATPAVDAVVSMSPTTLDLSFSEGLNLAFSGVDLTDATGAAITTGTGALSGPDGAVLTIPLNTPLAAGSYSVHWHALSNDGHKTEGSYSFTVKP